MFVARRHVRRALALAGALLVLLPASAAAQRQVHRMFGIHYGVPLRWSAAIAAGVALSPEGGEGPAGFLAVEPGLAGWRVSAGYIRLTGSLGSGYALRASVLRTGRHPWRAASRTTFVGVEGQLMPIFMLGLRAGGFYALNTTAGERRGLLTADLSLLL